jgi:hypothetical protein
MEHPVPDFHVDSRLPQRKKPGLLSETGLCSGLEEATAPADQPRVRERIMKLS